MCWTALLCKEPNSLRACVSLSPVLLAPLLQGSLRDSGSHAWRLALGCCFGNASFPFLCPSRGLPQCQSTKRASGPGVIPQQLPNAQIPAYRPSGHTRHARNLWLSPCHDRRSPRGSCRVPQPGQWCNCVPHSDSSGLSELHPAHRASLTSPSFILTTASVCMLWVGPLRGRGDNHGRGQLVLEAPGWALWMQQGVGSGTRERHLGCSQVRAASGSRRGSLGPGHTLGELLKEESRTPV